MASSFLEKVSAKIAPGYTKSVKKRNKTMKDMMDEQEVDKNTTKPKKKVKVNKSRNILDDISDTAKMLWR